MLFGCNCTPDDTTSPIALAMARKGPPHLPNARLRKNRGDSWHHAIFCCCTLHRPVILLGQCTNTVILSVLAMEQMPPRVDPFRVRAGAEAAAATGAHHQGPTQSHSNCRNAPFKLGHVGIQSAIKVQHTCNAVSS